MAPSQADMYEYLLWRDPYAFIQRSFLELNPQVQFQPGWHLEVLAAKLVDVLEGRCKRLILNVPPRHLKSHAVSIAFSAFVLGHDPSKQIISVCYAQDLSDHFARESRTLMVSPFIGLPAFRARSGSAATKPRGMTSPMSR